MSAHSGKTGTSGERGAEETNRCATGCLRHRLSVLEKLLVAAVEWSISGDEIRACDVL